MKHLRTTDPDVYGWVQKEMARERDGIGMIASENLASPAVIEALGTPLTNKYSEGYFSKRYYGGNEYIDQIERLAVERAKGLYGAEHANVQPHSGSQANQAAYLALLSPGDTVLAMSLTAGGHLTHGAPVNFSGKLYRFIHYGVRRDTERVDMDEVAALAKAEKPKLIVAGFSAYPRHLDFAAFRRIADEVRATLMVDMAHFAGLVAAKVHPDPIPYADVVTSSTHKTLRGPRGGFILCRARLAKAIDAAVFPGIQGGPLDNVVAAKAVGFLEAAQPSFVEYQKRVLRNARQLSKTLADEELSLVTDGTDNHLVLVDLTDRCTGGEAERRLDEAGIYVNKNMIPFDPRSPHDPSGLRIGTPAITTRGMNEPETRELAKAIAAVVKNPSGAVRDRARALVTELTDRFPLPYTYVGHAS